MALIHRVAAAMQRIAPLCLADRSWDNVGILVENPTPRSTGVVMLTIDLTPDVLAECIESNVEVVIAYHPTIFSSMKSLTLPRQDVVLRAITAGISVYSPHTSLDAVEGGINDWLAALVDVNGVTRPIELLTGLSESEKRHPRVSSRCGMGRLLELSAPLSFDDIVDRVKRGLGLSHVRVALPSSWAASTSHPDDDGKNSGKKKPSASSHPVRRVAICAGSGAGVFRKLNASNRVDVLLTGEMGHHEVLAARAAGQAVILCEHTNTERGFLKARLEELVKKELGDDVTVLTSLCDEDPLTVW